MNNLAKNSTDNPSPKSVCAKIHASLVVWISRNKTYWKLDISWVSLYALVTKLTMLSIENLFMFARRLYKERQRQYNSDVTINITSPVTTYIDPILHFRPCSFIFFDSQFKCLYGFCAVNKSLKTKMFTMIGIIVRAIIFMR